MRLFYNRLPVGSRSRLRSYNTPLVGRKHDLYGQIEPREIPRRWGDSTRSGECILDQIVASCLSQSRTSDVKNRSCTRLAIRVMHLSMYCPTYSPAGVWQGLGRDLPMKYAPNDGVLPIASV